MAHREGLFYDILNIFLNNDEKVTTNFNNILIFMTNWFLTKLNFKFYCYSKIISWKKNVIHFYITIGY